MAAEEHTEAEESGVLHMGPIVYMLVANSLCILVGSEKIKVKKWFLQRQVEKKRSTTFRLSSTVTIGDDSAEPVDCN